MGLCANLSMVYMQMQGTPPRCACCSSGTEPAAPGGASTSFRRWPPPMHGRPSQSAGCHVRAQRPVLSPAHERGSHIDLLFNSHKGPSRIAMLPSGAPITAFKQVQRGVTGAQRRCCAAARTAASVRRHRRAAVRAAAARLPPGCPGIGHGPLPGRPSAPKPRPACGRARTGPPPRARSAPWRPCAFPPARPPKPRRGPSNADAVPCLFWQINCQGGR